MTAGWGARRQPVSPAGGEHLPALGRLLGLRGHRRDPAGRQVRPARCERPRGLAAAHRRPRGPLRLRRVSGRASGPCRLPGGRQRLGLLFGQTRPPCQASGVSVGLSGWGRGRDPCEKCPLRLTGGVGPALTPMQEGEGTASPGAGGSRGSGPLRALCTPRLRPTSLRGRGPGESGRERGPCGGARALSDLGPGSSSASCVLAVRARGREGSRGGADRRHRGRSSVRAPAGGWPRVQPRSSCRTRSPPGEPRRAGAGGGGARPGAPRPVLLDASSASHPA